MPTVSELVEIKNIYDFLRLEVLVAWCEGHNTLLQQHYPSLKGFDNKFQ